MVDLRTSYLGLSLKSPLVASASPLTADLDQIAELARAGAGAIVLPSLFEEQIEGATGDIDHLLSEQLLSEQPGDGRHHDLDDYNRGVDDYLSLITAAKARVDVPVIASLNGTNMGYWLKYSRLVQRAGADALELNLYSIAADPIVSSVALEAEHTGIVALLAEDLDIPVSVKISPYYSALASFVLALQVEGAAGVVMFNRFYLPDFDLETGTVIPRIALSSPTDIQLPLRWVGILREHLSMSIAASSGVYSGFDAAKLILAGSDVVMATSSLLRHGAHHLTTITNELSDWMAEHGYDSVDVMRGSMRRESVSDPAAYERANYIGNVAAYTR